MSLAAVFSEISESAISHVFMDREFPVANFDEIFHVRKGFVGPFSHMLEESRIRILGDKYWREGAVVAEFLVRKQDAICVTAFRGKSVFAYGKFRIYAHFHGGHPFDKSIPLAEPCYNGPFISDRYCWGASVVAVPGQIAFKNKRKMSPKKESSVLADIESYYKRCVNQPRSAPYGELRFINCNP